MLHGASVVLEIRVRRGHFRRKRTCLGERARLRSKAITLVTTLSIIVCFAGCHVLPGRYGRKHHVVAAREQSRLGMEALQHGDIDEAQVRMEHAVRSCPEDAEARHHLAEVLAKQGRLKEARTQMETAVRLSCSDPAWSVELGRMALGLGDYAAAETCANDALARDLNLGLAWTLQGDVQHAHRNIEASMGAYHRALDCAVPDATALLRIAELYHQQGKFQRELASLRRYAAMEAESAHPKDLSVRTALALQSMHRHDEALAEFHRSEPIVNENPELQMRVAESYLATGQYAAAEQRLAAASAALPENPRLLELVSMVRQVRSPGTPVCR